MNTETITLTIGHETFFDAIVDFLYEAAVPATRYDPPEPEWLDINRVQLPIDIGDGKIWTDLNKDHYHLIKSQVLEFIEEQREEAELTRAITKLENRKELD